ncbi:helix-turn-helix domain protein [Emticicia oligotrophica DSM 17448]|uniref:Helix-turn-helix domain protein n=1 Tax=Emticicia oligotrophica (strain DSM 17448 / CIP 109782 / MTCC 6937 / GPTSA100-15) TaxID=929562 RepID=A0ABM5N6S4_EMTOG|nr:helix-turn-helix transcriptional regulator [Emticicia oligotrophica]AFK05134.1 helix-turn-helix domain protein [Emticicia oligotrophica DSM 17448]
MSLISNNLKYLRRINGLTQEQFARRIGTKRANVGAYEESRAIPPVDLLKIIANTFGITVDDFVKRDIRKLRETPDLTFGFESKPFYGNVPEESVLKEIDPFDIPINNLPNFEEKPFHSTPPPKDFDNYSVPAIGDLMKKFLGENTQSFERHTETKTTENVAQSVTLKPSFEREAPISAPPTTAQQTPFNQTNTGNIQYVRRLQFNEYLVRYSDINFLKTLFSFSIPTLTHGEYRAFEAGEDFSFEGALLIGSLVKNWHEILDGKNYVLVTKSQGIIYRRVYNQVKIKGTLLLSTDNNRFPSSEIPFTDVIETWEIKAFVSNILPEPITPYSKLGTLVDEMKFELERIKK